MPIQSLVIKTPESNLLKKAHKASESRSVPCIKCPALTTMLIHRAERNDLPYKIINVRLLVAPLNFCYTCQHIMTASCQVLKTKISVFRVSELGLRSRSWK